MTNKYELTKLETNQLLTLGQLVYNALTDIDIEWEEIDTYMANGISEDLFEYFSNNKGSKNE